MCVRDFAVIDEVPMKVGNEKNTSNFNFEVEMNKAATSSKNFEGEQQAVILQMKKLGIDVFEYSDMTH